MQFNEKHLDHFIKLLFLDFMSDKHKKKIKYFTNVEIYKKELFEIEEFAEIVKSYKFLLETENNNDLNNLHDMINCIDTIIVFFSKHRCRTSSYAKDKLGNKKKNVSKLINSIEKGKPIKNIKIDPVIVNDKIFIDYLLNWKPDLICSYINFENKKPIIESIKECCGDKLHKIISEKTCKNSFDYFINFFN